jgi:hypothetical protein
MKKTIAAVLLGLVTWTLVASLGNRLLRAGLQGYAAAEPGMLFTHTMLMCRLLLGAVSSLCAGFVAAWIAGPSDSGTKALAVVLLVLFVPLHYSLWVKFPAWYHIVFLASLPLLTLLGAKIRARTAAGRTG